MRFVTTWLITEAIEKFTLVPPCEGYFEDVSAQFYLPGIALEDRFWLMIGKKLNDAVIALVPNASGEVVILPEISDNNYVVKVTGKEDITEFTSNKLFQYYIKNWGNKRLYIGRNEIVHVFMTNPDFTALSQVLLQGSFIPKTGSVYKEIHRVGALIIGADFEDIDRWVFPMDLKNVQMKVTVVVDEVGTEGTGIAYFRLTQNGYDEFTDTLTNAEGNILDENMVDQTVQSGHGLLGSMLINSASTAADQTTHFEEIIQVGDVKEGDAISWDVDTVNGTFPAANSCIMMFAGIVDENQYSKEALFIKSPKIINISGQEEANL